MYNYRIGYFFNTDNIEAKHTASRNNVTISMTLLPNSKVQLVATSHANSFRHMVLDYSDGDKSKTSVVHRPGFSIEQAVDKQYLELNNDITKLNDTSVSFIVINLEGSVVFEDNASFILWKPSDASGA